MAQRSFTSGMYEKVMDVRLFQEGVHLNSSTIVFLDFSVNDKYNPGAPFQLELLLRHILKSSATSSPPMIIVLSTVPGSHERFYKVMTMLDTSGAGAGAGAGASAGGGAACSMT
jgi:hypothetical protein